MSQPDTTDGPHVECPDECPEDHMGAVISDPWADDEQTDWGNGTLIDPGGEKLGPVIADPWIDQSQSDWTTDTLTPGQVD